MIDHGNALRGLSLEDLRRAVDIYLNHAYPDGQPPESILRRLNWAVAQGIPGLLTERPFETVLVPDPAHSPIYALRLGNHAYPHMKLQVQPWNTQAGYLLTVNTHDQVSNLDPSMPGATEFRELQVRNRTIKEAIEQDWDSHGLPNFHRYLRECLSALEDPASGDSASSSSALT